MRVLLYSAVATVSLFVASAVQACAPAPPPKPESGSPPPAPESGPEAQPRAADVLALTRGQSINDVLKIAGAGLGGAIVAGSIAWSIARRPKA